MFFCLFDFSAAEKDSSVKLCMLVRLLSGMSFSHFGELWLEGVTAVALLPGCTHRRTEPGGGSRRGSMGSRNWVPWLGAAVGIGGGGVA